MEKVPMERVIEVDPQAEHSIARRALLARIKLGSWGGGITDRATTEKIRQDAGAQRDHGRYIKWLVDRDSLKGLKKVARDIRRLHIETTLPWQDTWRILPVTMYHEYSRKMGELESQLVQERTELAQRFLSIKDDAKRRLGNLYRETDYPTRDQIAARFYLHVEHAQVPDVSNFYVDLAEDEKEEVAKSVRNHLEARLQGAVADLYQRLGNTVEWARNAMDGGRFPTGLWKAIEEVCDLAPRLNVTEHEGITEAVANLRAVFSGVDAPKTMRKTSKDFDENKTREVSEKLDSLRTKMAGYYSVTEAEHDTDDDDAAAAEETA